MKELVANLLFSALSNLFRNQPDMSAFTPHTQEREPNLSFHLANELWPYLFWLQCDFDVTKPHAGDRRPDIIFHRRGFDALNFLVVEVKRNPEGVEDDIRKIHDFWFRPDLSYRFGASVLINVGPVEFSVQLFENVDGDASLRINNDHRARWRPAIHSMSVHYGEICGLANQIDEEDRAGGDPAALKRRLDRLVSGLYEPL